MYYPSQFLKHIENHIETSMIGKQQAIRLILIALISGGHVLMEDVPGVGKTTLLIAIAKSFDCTFQRIQFTPDVTPSDVVGFSMYNQKTQEFEFKKGAVFCQVLLADEINRTTAKTQSSLLEAMEEGQVTVDAVSHTLPAPFIVFATQNPIEHTGTFALPEAQVDRFLMKIHLGYPNHGQEMDILSLHRKPDHTRNISAIASPSDILRLREMAQSVEIDERVSDYMVRLIQATRSHHQILLGASPRVTIGLAKAARAFAMLQDRDFVTPDDIQQLALPVIAHRIHLTPDSKLQNITSEAVIEQILQQTPVPAL